VVREFGGLPADRPLNDGRDDRLAPD
jgi:hypothetical protein